MRAALRGLLVTVLFVLWHPVPVAAQNAPSEFLSSTTCPGTGCTLVNTTDKGSVGITLVVTGTAVASFEVSNDGFQHYSTAFATPPNSTTAVTTASASGQWSVSVAGWTQFRVRLTTCTSCTVQVIPTPSIATSASSASVSGTFSGNAAASATAAAVPSSADYIGVNIGGNLTGVTGVSAGSHKLLAAGIFTSGGTQIDTFGGGTQYAEGATAATITGNAVMFETNTGTNALGVVNASQPLPVTAVVTSVPTTTVTATNLDVQIGGSDTLTVQATNLDVQIGGSDTVAVSNAGLTELAAAINSNLVDVNIVSGAGSGGTALADDADFTAGSTSFTPIGGFYQSTVTPCTDGDTCAFGITAQRTLKFTPFTSGGAEMQPDTQFVWGGPGTWAAGTGPTGGYNNPCRVSASAPSTTGVIDDDTITPWCKNTGELQVGLSSAIPAGTNAIGKLAANSGVDIGDVDVTSLPTGASAAQVQGTVAHGASDGQNPVKVGGKADGSLADNTPVTTGQRTDAMFDLDGVLITRPWAPLADLIQARTTDTGGSSTSLISAAGSGVFQYLTYCTFSNSSATAITVDLRDGTAGSILWTGPVPANTNGAHIIFPTPLKFSANTAIAFDASGATTTLTVACGGFKSKAG